MTVDARTFVSAAKDARATRVYVVHIGEGWALAVATRLIIKPLQEVFISACVVTEYDFGGYRLVIETVADFGLEVIECIEMSMPGIKLGVGWPIVGTDWFVLNANAESKGKMYNGRYLTRGQYDAVKETERIDLRERVYKEDMQRERDRERQRDQNYRDECKRTPPPPPTNWEDMWS